MRERDRGRGTCQRDFEESFLKAIDEGLSSLGDSGKQAVYFYLEEKFGLNKQEICNRPNDFADALERIFGLGANFLKLLILKQLRERTEAWHPLYLKEWILPNV
jgi:hypothetical protein